MPLGLRSTRSTLGFLFAGKVTLIHQAHELEAPTRHSHHTGQGSPNPAGCVFMSLLHVIMFMQATEGDGPAGAGHGTGRGAAQAPRKLSPR